MKEAILQTLLRWQMNKGISLVLAVAMLMVTATGCKKDERAYLSVQMKSLEDKAVTLSDYNGKVVLVNFWATWCDPCRMEIPWLIAMQDKYGSKGFTVLGIAMDEEGKPVVAPFVAKERYDVNGQQLPMNYPIVIGNELVAEKFGGLLGYPTSILISRDGKKIKRVTGVINEDEISKLIDGAL